MNLTTVRWVPRSIAPSSVATVASTTSPWLQVLIVVGLPLEERLPLDCRRQQGADDLDGLRRGAQRRTDRGTGQHEVAGVETLESRQGLQRLQRLVDHVAFDEHVLANLAVDAQPQPQVAESLELVGVEQHQRRADRGEGRIGLCFVELGLRQLDVAGGDIVGDDEPGDVVGQVRSR